MSSVLAGTLTDPYLDFLRRKMHLASSHGLDVEAGDAPGSPYDGWAPKWIWDWFLTRAGPATGDGPLIAQVPSPR